MRRDKADKIIKILRRTYPEAAKAVARRGDPFRTVIATALSAQTTDDQVDRVTPALFRRYPTPARLAAARASDVEGIIKSVGLYKAKARNIIAAARMIVEEFNGRVPRSRELLVRLPGVGRKTANVVLIKAFGVPAMPVDTHVFRVANRIGLVSAKTPAKTEEELVGIIPKKYLGIAHFWLILHGRGVCHARNPKCGDCPVSGYCRYYHS